MFFTNMLQYTGKSIFELGQSKFGVAYIFFILYLISSMFQCERLPTMKVLVTSEPSSNYPV